MEVSVFEWVVPLFLSPSKPRVEGMVGWWAAWSGATEQSVEGGDHLSARGRIDYSQGVGQGRYGRESQDVGRSQSDLTQLV